jgi:MFS family permease
MERPAGARRSYAYWVLAALFAMNLLNYIDRFILAAVVKHVQTSLGIDDAKGGFLGSIFFLSYAVFSPVMGWFGDRLTRKYLLAAGVAVWSVATFASGLVETYPQMLLARSVLGVGEASYAILAPTLIADLFPRQQRNRALAVFYVAIPVGAALGYLLGGQIYAHHDQLAILPFIERTLEAVTGQQFDAASRGWRMAFFVVGLPGLLVALAALALPEPRRGATEGVDEAHLAAYEALPLEWATYAVLFRNRSYLYNLLGMAMVTFALGGLQFWAPKFLSEPIGAMDQEQANLGLGLAVVVAGLVGTPLGAWLADRLALRYRGAYFLMSGTTLLIAVPFILAALLGGLYDKGAVVIFGNILVGLTLALLNYGPSNAITINVTAPKMRAAAFAVNTFGIHILGDIPSPWLMGQVSDWARAYTDAKYGLFLGLAITLPALILSGTFYLLGTGHLERDQEAMLQELRVDVLGDKRA